MKKIILPMLLVLLSAAPATAGELRVGIQNVQVRDQAFESFSTSGWDEFWDIGSLQFFNLTQVEWAGEVWNEDTDLLLAMRFATESGNLEGLSAQLLLVEPSVGLRRTFLRPAPGLALFGQASLGLPWLESQVTGRDSSNRSVDYASQSVFPLVSAAVGAIYRPNLGGGNPLGLSIEAGYTTPANFDLDDQGDLKYGGVTYGALLSISLAGDDWAPIGKALEPPRRKKRRVQKSAAPMRETENTATPPARVTAPIQKTETLATPTAMVIEPLQETESTATPTTMVTAPTTR